MNCCLLTCKGCWSEVAKELKEHRTKAIIVIVIILLVEVSVIDVVAYN